MTVCIAALCREGDESRVVVATDRMVTFPGFIEFEHATPKMLETSARAIAMTAGDTLVGTRISHEVADSITGTIPVLEIAQRLAAHYDTTRKVRAYARGGIGAVWVVALGKTPARDRVIVFEDPFAGAYRSRREVRRGDVLAIPDLSEFSIAVSDFL